MAITEFEAQAKLLKQMAMRHAKRGHQTERLQLLDIVETLERLADLREGLVAGRENRDEADSDLLADKLMVVLGLMRAA